MKRTFSKLAFVFGLSLLLLSLCEQVIGAVSTDDTLTLVAQSGKGNRGGGNKPPSGRGGGGGNPQNSPPGNRSVPNGSVRGGIHAPSGSGSRRSAGRNQQQQQTVRTPSFSLPNPGVPSQRIQLPGARHSGTDGPMRSVSGSRIPDFERGARRSGNLSRQDVLAGATSRLFGGNTVRFNNRTFSIGSSNYRPPQYRHSRYHGNWNWNGIPGYGLNTGWNGYGADWGFGSRYGSGYGDYYGYGGHGFGYRPLGWGLGGWGLGSLIYNSGYLNYWNPYYYSRGPVIYDYAQPVIVSYSSGPIETGPDSPEAILDDATIAFQNSDYDAALDITNHGISRYPDDAMLHEFRSLVLFAKQDYQQSAATIHAVLAVGPGWDWTTMIRLYSGVAVYTEQLRALEAFTVSNPQDAPSRFLLAYHYLTCGHTDAGARQLTRVVQLMPSDRLAADLLKMLEPPDPANTPRVASAGSSDADQARNANHIDPASLAGEWTATRDDGSIFHLSLTDDQKFTWSFERPSQPAQTFSGAARVEENVLSLERPDGGALIAEISGQSDVEFHFRLLGTDEQDHGLTFRR